jgi:hypothetical protein
MAAIARAHALAAKNLATPGLIVFILFSLV